MADKTYQVATDNEGKYYPKGPGTGLGYHGGYLYPATRFPDRESTEKTVALMNDAFNMGAAQARREMQRAMGLA